MTKLKFKNPYSPSADDEGISCGPGMTEQHHQEHCDINNMINRFVQTGEALGNAKQALFEDVSEFGDYLETQLKLKKAEESFNNLDPHIRKRFNNQPIEMIKFLSDKNNTSEAQALGLLKPTTPVKDNSIPTTPVT